jgi:hypothetical protein
MFTCTWFHLHIEDSGYFLRRLKGPWKYEALKEEEDTFDLGAVKNWEIKKSDVSRVHA